MSKSLAAGFGDKRHFVLYRAADKTPVDPVTGGSSNAQDAATHMILAVALGWLAALGEGYGVGVVIIEGSQLFAIDLDGCLSADGVLTPAAHSIVQQYRKLGAYIEVSMSARGVHIIGSYAGAAPPHRCKNHNLPGEMYSKSRYIALTGNPLKGEALGDTRADCTDAIRLTAHEYFRPDPNQADAGNWTTEDDSACTITGTDEERLALALKTKSMAARLAPGKVTFEDLWTVNAEKLGRVWPGNNGQPYDASSADQALCNHAAFYYANNCERILKVIQGSALKRSKWERQDYIRGTILKACAIPKRWKPRRDVPAARALVAPPLPPAVANNSGLVDSNGAPLPAARVVAVDQVMLADQFTKTKGGVIHGSVRNAVAYLTGVSRMGEVFFDEFSLRIFFEGQEWSSLNETPLLLAIQTTAPAISPDTFARAVEAMALSQRRDRLKDWINTLPPWDGERRLTLWLHNAFGCPTDRYHMRVGRNWLISMIARGQVPGCKVDTMPVLEGLQGKRKSMALEGLAEPFFVEAPHVKFGDKDFLQCLQGAWLIELPELSSLRSADVDSIKATITKRVDRYRAPYARRPEDHARRHVFAGTVNESDYLRDTTGNRRFLPVDCVTVNLEWIKANRDQLFAEALVAFKAGRNWWTFPHEATAEMQDSRLPSDPWASLIARWLTANPGKTWVTSDDLHCAIGIPAERRNRTTEIRLGKVMRKGFPQWHKSRMRLPGVWQQLERGWELRIPPPPKVAT